MSSRSFEAKTGHTASNPQLCGLHGSTGCASEGVEGAIMQGQMCFYLTCKGNEARPAYQIQKSNKRDDYSTGYRIVKTGTRTVGKEPFTRQQPVFGWQEQRNGRWHDLVVWERMVHTLCAEEAGYVAPGDRTIANPGDRTQRHAHQVSKTPESPLKELARVIDEPEQQEAKDDLDDLFGKL